MFYNKQVTTFVENGKKITLFSLALPLFFEHIFALLYGTANTYLLSGYSNIAVSATSVSNEILSVVTVLINMVVTGTVIVSSVSIGSNDYERAGKTSFTGLAFVFGISFVFGVIMSSNATLFTGLMNLDATTQTIAVEYFKIMAAFLPFTAILTFFNQIVICNGYSKFTMFGGITGNIINVLLCYAVLYTNICLPYSKIACVALASVISRLINLIIVIYIFVKKKCPIRRSFNKKTAFDILRIGVPAGMCLFSYSLSQTVTTSFVASLGVTVISAKVYISNIINYTSKLGYAIGSANAVLTGRHRGANNFDSIKQLFKQNLTLAISFNVFLSVLAFVFHRPLISLFTKDEKTLQLAGSIMLIDIILEIGRAINNVTENSLNANGDVKTTLIFSIITCWLFGVLLAYLLCITAGLGLVGLWIGFAVQELAKGTAYLIRWKSGKWKNLKV